jgi:hypothetical protein
VLLIGLAAGASLAAGAVLADRSASRSGGVQATAIAVVIVAAAVVAIAAVQQVRRTRNSSPSRTRPSARDAFIVQNVIDDEARTETADFDAADPADFDSNVVQRLVRSRTDEGERVDGWLRATLQPQERNITLHVAFCPALDEAPRLTVRQVSGPASRIKAAQVLPYGMRLDVKRISAATEAAEVVIAFSAVVSAAAKV